MYKIAVMTTTRAEYGLLKPVLQKIRTEKEWELTLLVGGTHLSEKWGYTISEIEKDDFAIAAKISAFPEEDSALAVSKSMAKTMFEVAEILDARKLDLFLVLGDRYEIFAAVSAAYTLGIPVAHIAGGEVTAGALDEAYRHSITKMARLHFTANERYRQRVIQLGEDPQSVIVSGDTGAENIRKLALLTKKELAEQIGMPLERPYILATYHPVTLAESDCEREMQEVFRACEAFPEMNLLFTMANADQNGNRINQILEDYARENKGRVFVYASLGQLRYLSAMKHCAMVLGNSSSGILEAPTMGVPTVNIGSRQEGRLRATSIIDCKPKESDITEAIAKALSAEFREKISTMETKYNQVKEASEIIVREIKHFLKEQRANGIKRFYDLPRERQD